jgi:CHAD domain-containing protein
MCEQKREIKGQSISVWIEWINNQLENWEEYHGNNEYSRQMKYVVEALGEVCGMLQSTPIHKHANEMKDILEKILNAGTWFNSALEIDLYEQSYNGEELEQMIVNVLNKIEREKND